MVQRIVCLFILSNIVTAWSMGVQAKDSLIKILLSQSNIRFTQQEKETLQQIDEQYATASMCQLGNMKAKVDEILKGKIRFRQYLTNSTKYSFKGPLDQTDTMLININKQMQQRLTVRICKKIDSCALITALLMTSTALTYIAALAIHEQY